MNQCLLKETKLGRSQQYYQRFVPNFNHTDQTVLLAQKYCAHTQPSDLTISALAAKVHVSERTLSRRFRLALNMSPGHYIQQIRIEASKRILDLRLNSIEQVASIVGYQDVSNFNRAFKRVCGISPAEYRDRGA